MPSDGGTTQDDVVSTGSPVLDQMLNGGLPTNRATLVTGGPGTGKSTLGMQFLQEGLQQGERCLFVSTEQTIDELRDSFRSFEFDLEHENLAFTTIHATVGRTFESVDQEEVTLETFEDGELLGEGFSAPFTGEYVEQHLSGFAPRDRIVFDSASGLEAISDDPNIYRRTVLDLIRLFTDEFEATSIFTAEYVDQAVGDADANLLNQGGIQFSTHGVIRLWRELVNNDVHRYLQILKMRGVNHDRRRAEVDFASEGLSLGPIRRSQPPALKQHVHAPIGIDGLDKLTGGGLLRGAGVVLQHDGKANLTALFSVLLARMIERDYTITLVPTIHLRSDRLNQLLEGHDLSLEAAFDDDQLYVIDMTGAWDHDDEHVYGAPSDAETMLSRLDEIRTTAGDDSDRHVTIVNAESIVHALGEKAAREIRYRQEASMLGEADMLLYVHNPSVTSDEIGEFFVDTAVQVLDTQLTEDGLQYITLEKSPCGFVGSTSLVEYIYEPPYIKVQEPPQERENPAVLDE